MARLTKDQWLEARQQWEADPTISYAALAERIGVSDVAVLKAAKREGWVKSGSLASINRAAHIKADAAIQVTPQVSDTANHEVSAQTSKKPLPASTELSTDLRAKLIQSHRAEWRKHASLYPLEGIKEDFGLGKSAKISSEMLSIRQKAERIAWGMDTEAADTTITINNPRSFD